MRTLEEQAGYELLHSLDIAIVGLGLMGGSLALALRGAAKKLIGIDTDLGSCEQALRLGVVDEIAVQLEAGIAGADLVVLAVPVMSIMAAIRALPGERPEGCMILDLGSTKREINQAMDELPPHFAALGGHPMCGREQSGLSAATNDLYQGETFILCRNDRTTSGIEAVALAVTAYIGARPLFMPADIHDELVATSSHLPYVVSSLLMARAWDHAKKDERLWRVSASGLRDTTRLAGSNPQMMLEIMLTNRKPLLNQIEAYGQALADMADAIQKDDREALLALLNAAHQQHDGYMRAKYERDQNIARD